MLMLNKVNQGLSKNTKKTAEMNNPKQYVKLKVQFLIFIYSINI